MQITYTTPGGTYPGIYADALKQTHLLIAGAPGSGKSVIINGLVYAALHSFPFDTNNGKQFILIDPKGTELYQYATLPHTVKYAYTQPDMLAALEYAGEITDSRFRSMRSRGLRFYDGGALYIIIDEFADLMLTQRKQVQPLIQHIAQLGRAANVHLIIATQTPIIKVLPTEIKCSIDSRIGLRTRSAQDSRNIIGIKGLETLPRYGQGYYMRPEGEDYYIIPMIPETDLTAIVDHWQRQTPRRSFRQLWQSIQKS